jgi:hypothetical protein
MEPFRIARPCTKKPITFRTSLHLPTDGPTAKKTTHGKSFSFAPIIAVSVHDTRLGMEGPRQPANQARRRHGESLSYDVLALGPIAEETLRDGGKQ